jgi:hypothetical protein
VAFSVTLSVSAATTPAALTATFPLILQQLYLSFGEPYASNPSLITLTSLQFGSLVINGAASTSNVDPTTAYNNIQAGLQNNNNIGGYGVASHSVQAQGFTPQQS